MKNYRLSKMYVELMNEQISVSERDEEMAHSRADGILCELLRKLGYSEVVESFKKVKKWYA